MAEEHVPAPAWSTTTGQSIVKAMAGSSDSTEAVDRALIAERIFRYGWSFDERSLELLGDNFTADGTWEAHIMGTVDLGPFIGKNAIVEYMSSFWDDQIDQRRHVFSNVIVDDYAGTTATAHAYLILMASTGGESHIETTGPYRFAMTKEADGVWRMSQLKAGFDSPF